MPEPLDFWSARQLLQAYRTKTLSPVEATRATLSRIDPYLRAGAEAGRSITAAAYHAALMTRQAIAARMEALYADHDLLVLPGFHVPPPPVPGLPDGLRGKAPALTC